MCVCERARAVVVPFAGPRGHSGIRKTPLFLDVCWCACGGCKCADGVLRGAEGRASHRTDEGPPRRALRASPPDAAVRRTTASGSRTGGTSDAPMLVPSDKNFNPTGEHETSTKPLRDARVPFPTRAFLCFSLSRTGVCYLVE